MSRPLFFAFYPVDFADDINVAAMSTTAVGAYILLLCKAWQSEPPGSLPNNDLILARLARLNAVEWAEVRAAVLACFELRTDGRLHQVRLRREYDRSLAAMKAKRRAGGLGAAALWGRINGTHGRLDGRGMAVPMALPEQSQASAREIGELEEERKDKEPPLPPAKPGGGEGVKPPGKRRGEVNPRFAAFWGAYPRKIAKPKAQAAFGKLNVNDAMLAAILAALAWQCQSEQWLKEGGTFVPYPATWLNNHRWEDEPGPSNAASTTGFQPVVFFDTQPPRE